MALLSSDHEIPASHLNTGSAVPGTTCQVGPDGNAAFLPPGGTTASASRMIWVSPLTGSDTKGNGSLDAPFATYSQASTVALAMTPAPVPSDQVLVVFTPGSTSENIAIQLNVPITCLDPSASSLTLNGTLTLGSTFAAEGGDVSICNCVVTGDIDFAFNPAFAQGVQFFGVSQEFGSVTFTGGGLGVSNVFLLSSIFASSPINATDVTFDVISSSLIEVNLVALNFPAQFLGVNISGNVETLILDGRNGHTCEGQNSNVAIGNLTLRGTGATYTGDISGSIPYEANQPTLTDGALISQYVITGAVPFANLAPSTWVSLAAGGTLAPSPTQTKIVFDTTGAAGVVNLPASGTAADGEEHLVKGRGATTTGSMTVNAGAGNFIESYASPGTFSGAGGAAVIAAATHAGWIASYKYQLSTTQWILQGIY